MANTVSITDIGLDSREAPIFDETPEREFYAKPSMNYAKLARYNMTQPYAKRISVADIKAKVKMAAFRGFAMALLATIHSKIDSKIAEKEARYSNH